MPNAERPIFALANRLYREGRLQEALSHYAVLYRAEPRLVAYRMALESCLRMLGKSLDDLENVLPSSADTSIDWEVATHPASVEPAKAACHFVVVTPVLNGAEFIEMTMESVLSQAGDFYIDYVIKDGGSSDGTIQVVLEWCKRIRSGEYPLRSRGIRLGLLTSKDRGLYDAVATGFEVRILPESAILTYINADDVLAANACEIAALVFNQIPSAQWLIGQPHVIDENNALLHTTKFPVAFNREDILAGRHNGRSNYFVQQEGCFWRANLYRQVGGVNREFRMAGDFDLWRRFALQTEPLTVSKPLASFRRRKGQLSSNLDAYYREAERVPSFEDSAEAPTSGAGEMEGRLFNNAVNWGFPCFEIQRPGAVCFLDDKNAITEIAYLKRTYLCF